jgi:hypothetical protein
MVLAGLIFGLTSCEKIIEPKNLPEQDPRIVLNSVIKSDSVFRANISISKSIISGKDYKVINDAVCELYANGQYFAKLINIGKGNYATDTMTKAKTNTKYTLKVGVSGYKNVEGTSTVPGTVTVLRSVRYDTTNSRFFNYTSPNGSNINGILKYRIYLKDDINTVNFYGIAPKVILLDSLGTVIPAIASVYISSNIENGLGGTYINNGLSLETDDKYLVNGNEVSFDVSLNITANVSQNANPKSAEIRFDVSSYSEELYKYKVTLSQQSNTSGGLFSEPVLVYSNINSGMGIVGCINSQSVSIGKIAIRRN